MSNFDRTATRKTTLHHDQDADDAAYWQTRSVEERMEALKFLRQQAYSFYFRFFYDLYGTTLNCFKQNR